MKFAMIISCLMLVVGVSAQAPQRRVELLCHRTANKDAPENSLESLEQAALLGCDVIEIDVRRTLDGVLVLNHDGFLERLTDGEGEAETTLYGDLQLRETGRWMGARWQGLHFARLEDALRVARDHDVQLILDIKTKGIGADVLQVVDREGMRSRVRFNGEWDDVKKLYPEASHNGTATWLQPGATATQIATLHHDGKVVIVNFSANAHEMDLASMKAAVAAGADGINVDYPRLGADAVGRPVEAKLSSLIRNASKGESSARVQAVVELSRYRGEPLQAAFKQWLLDPDANVSRAAAVALVTDHPHATAASLTAALTSPYPVVRGNAAWALGVLHAPASLVLPLLQDKDAHVLQEALLALSHMPGDVPALPITPLLTNPDTRVRGSAAVALAAHQPVVAMSILPARFRVEIKDTLKLYDAWAAQGKPTLSPAEIKTITDRYRCEMKFLQAIGSLDGAEAIRALEEQAFHAGDDFTQIHALVAAFQLWDRIQASPQDAVAQLGSSDAGVADRAELMLTMAGPTVLPAVRVALGSETPTVRERAIHVVAFQGDAGSVRALQGMKGVPSAQWALTKIQSLAVPAP
jgi:glycerophosphoryl diester phosphodiesterase/HEAT repeat protein